MIQMDFVIGGAADIQASAAGGKSESNFSGTFGKFHPRAHRNFSLLLGGAGPRFKELLFQVMLFELFFELAERWLNGNSIGENVHVRLDRHGRESAITTIVNVIDRGR